MLVVLVITTSCSSFGNIQQEITPLESVLSENMRICVSYGGENICIASSGNTKRIITWEGEEHSINMVPRAKRWLGTLGLTDPGQPENILKTQKGPVEALFTEAQITYDSFENSLKDLGLYRDIGIKLVYNDNGLLVMWRKTERPGLNVLDLSIFQIIVNGEKPKFLSGSQNQNIIITRLTKGGKDK